MSSCRCTIKRTSCWVVLSQVVVVSLLTLVTFYWKGVVFIFSVGKTMAQVQKCTSIARMMRTPLWGKSQGFRIKWQFCVRVEVLPSSNTCWYIFRKNESSIFTRIRQMKSVVYEVRIIGAVFNVTMTAGNRKKYGKSLHSTNKC